MVHTFVFFTVTSDTHIIQFDNVRVYKVFVVAVSYYIYLKYIQLAPSVAELAYCTT